MKFTQSDVNNLQQIIQICGLISIDSFLIADGLLSGVNSDRTAAFINVDDIPVLPEGAKLGISKLKTFKDRLDIFKSDPNLSIEAKQKANGEVSDLIVSGSSAKVSYRAAPIAAIKAPKAINDVEVKKVFLARDEVQLILNASRALSSGKLTITVAKGGDVTIELLDDSNDKFELSLETKAENLGESNKQFTTYFFTDVFSAVIKASAALYETFPIIISEASAKIRVGSYDITLLSPMDND